MVTISKIQGKPHTASKVVDENARKYFAYNETRLSRLRIIKKDNETQPLEIKREPKGSRETENKIRKVY